MLLLPRDSACLDFKDIYSQMFKAALKAEKSNSHSPNPPKVLKILTVSSSQVPQYPRSHPDNQGLPTRIYPTGARKKFGTYISTAFRIDPDTHDQKQQATKTQTYLQQQDQRNHLNQRGPEGLCSLRGEACVSASSQALRAQEKLKLLPIPWSRGEIKRKT